MLLQAFQFLILVGDDGPQLLRLRRYIAYLIVGLLQPIPELLDSFPCGLNIASGCSVLCEINNR